ncbi:MAG: ABC transporter permease [Candidatus Bipolaricaulota bacterium]
MRGLSLRLGLALILLALGLVLVGAVWTPHPPTRMTGDNLASPSFSHPMGTDWFGRDILSRVMAGGRSTLAVAAIAVAAGGLLGTALGGWAGYRGGLAGEIMMRAADLLLAFPTILAGLVLAAIWGPGVLGVAVALAAANVPFFARIARAGFMTFKERQYVVAARAVGAGDLHIVVRHILPNMSSPLVVQATVSLAGAVLAEAALSYLGLGVQPPHPSWGRMLQEAQSYFHLSPWPALFPGLTLAALVLGLNVAGDGLRDYLDPALRGLTPQTPDSGQARK